MEAWYFHLEIDRDESSLDFRRRKDRNAFPSFDILRFFSRTAGRKKGWKRRGPNQHTPAAAPCRAARGKRYGILSRVGLKVRDFCILCTRPDPSINRCVRVQGAPRIKPTVSVSREFISADSSLPDNSRTASRKREKEREAITKFTRTSLFFFSPFVNKSYRWEIVTCASERITNSTLRSFIPCQEHRMRRDWFIIRLIPRYESYSSSKPFSHLRCVNSHFSNCYRYFLFRSRNSLTAFTREYQIRGLNRAVELSIYSEYSIGARNGKTRRKEHRLFFNYASSSKSKVAKRGGERTGLPSSLSPLLPTYSRRMYTYIYIYIYIRTHERSTRYTRLLAAPLLPRYEQFAHVCDARFSFILGRNAEWQKRAQVVSLPRSANESLRFWISPLVQQTQVLYIYIDRFFPSFHFISITGGGKIYTYIFITKKKNRRVATQRIVAREAKVSVRLNAASSTGERVLDGRNVDREQ